MLLLDVLSKIAKFRVHISSKKRMLASYGVSVAVVCVQVFGDTRKVTTGWYHTFFLLFIVAKE